MNDLPLPPPPSPTQLQQFEIYNNNNNNMNNNNNNDNQHTRTLSSLSSMSTGSNTTHSSTQSLSPTPYNYHHNNTLVQQQQQQQQHQMTHYPTHNESTHSSLSLDHYGSTSPLHSRQASSSSSSLNYDNYGTIATIPPPPPPPLPEDNNQDYINTMKQLNNTNNRKLLMTKQNENDMNTYNKTNVSSSLTPATASPLGGGAVAGATGTPPPPTIVPNTQKVYNKFLKEYSNKLLTQGNNNNNNSLNTTTNNMSNNTNNNIHSYINNGTPKPFIASQNSNSSNSKQTQQQHNHYLQQQQQQQTNNNNNIINNSSLPSVAAITATLNNQLKFDSCQVAPPQPPLPTAIATAATKTPSSSNLSIIDKSPFNNSSNIINDNCNTTTNEMSATMATGPSSGDKPFEYVTLTGNVIRSVVPPGKGNVNYKVNQGGYARPYGAAPPAAAPKSPVSYPPQQQYQQPQQQQWNQPPPTQPKPTGGNAYATLPRSNVGQQDRSGPVTMAFQALDEHMVRDQSQTPSRPYTPSMINKPAPITPYYQTPERLCFDECPATHARDYDRRSASPFPDRARSPAPGPPPNPLAAIRAPRLKETEVSPLSPRVLQAGSITTGQSYLGAQQAQQQERLLSHTATGSQSAMQSFTQQPEKREKMQVGNMTVERSEKASRLEEQKQSQMQSHTTTQVGNTQIERRRKVTEEFEHTSSAKTVEIRTGSQSSSTERRQSYGKTGYVANQARRLSGLEQEITNLTSQSQAISARAATLTETKFPELHSQGGPSQFPTKPVLPPHDESQPPSYYVSGATIKKLDEPASTSFPPAQQKPSSSSTSYGASLVSSQQSQSQQQQQQQKSLTTLSTTSSSHQQKQQQANTVSCSLTKASATTCTNNQAYQSITAGSNLNATSTSTTTTSSATGTAPTGVCPVTGTFCRPGHTCCKQQLLQQSNNNGSRPTASLGSAGSKPSQAAASSNITANMQSQSSAAAATAPAPSASKRPSVSAPSNNTNNDSATGGMAPKGGAYGATTAPKRGRGILNKAVASGVRVPTCNSCSTHIRGPFITALGKIWCPEHFHCVNGNCRRPLQDIGFVEEKGDLYCEYCFEKYLAPTCSKCAGKIKGDCLNAIGKHFHPECFACGHCGKLFGNTPFFLEDGMPYCEADWNELFTTKCFACGFPVEAGDRWVEALNHNYHSQCFNCTYCKQNLEGQSFYNKGGRPFCKNHAR